MNPKNIKWAWGACGKHPSAKDYFRLNINSSLFQAFERWTEKGFDSVSNDLKDGKKLCSWRFWAKGIKKGQIVCGLVKTSSDSIGRPYPLLVVGAGFIAGWEDNWDILTETFEAIWQRIEYISTRRFSNLEDFKAEINVLRDLPLQYGKIKADREVSRSISEGDNHRNQLKPGNEVGFTNNLEMLAREKALILLLENQDSMEVSDSIRRAQYRFRSAGISLPNAVFIGGSASRQFLAIFGRSIKTQDFVRLWTLPGDD